MEERLKELEARIEDLENRDAANAIALSVTLSLVAASDPLAYVDALTAARNAAIERGFRDEVIEHLDAFILSLESEYDELLAAQPPEGSQPN